MCCIYFWIIRRMNNGTMFKWRFSNYNFDIKQLTCLHFLNYWVLQRWIKPLSSVKLLTELGDYDEAHYITHTKENGYKFKSSNILNQFSLKVTWKTIVAQGETSYSQLQVFLRSERSNILQMINIWFECIHMLFIH